MQDTVIPVNNTGTGKADETLQQTLFGKYMELIVQNDKLPTALCFYAQGMKLICEGSPAGWVISWKRKCRPEK